jgi:hypothetical protein
MDGHEKTQDAEARRRDEEPKSGHEGEGCGRKAGQARKTGRQEGGKEAGQASRRETRSQGSGEGP